MDNHRFLINIFLNATLMFIISYLLLATNNQLLTIFISHDFDIETTWFSSHVHFFPPLNIMYLNRDAIVSVVMAAPIVSLFIGMGVQFIYLSHTVNHIWLSLLLLWLIIHAYNFFFGAIGHSFIPGTPLAAAENAFQLHLETKLIITIAVIFILFKIGNYIGYAILTKSAFYPTSDTKNRLMYMMATLIGPWITGSIILATALKMTTVSQLLPFMTIGFLIIPAFTRAFGSPPQNIPKQQLSNKFCIIAFIFILIFITVLRMITRNGLNLYL